MKFTIGKLQQDKCIEMGLDITDAHILTCIHDLAMSKKVFHKIINNRIYIWISYRALIHELPILGINDPKGMARRFEKYIDHEDEEINRKKKSAKLLFRHVVRGKDEFLYDGKKRSRCGTYLYFAFNLERLHYLMDYSDEIILTDDNNCEGNGEGAPMVMVPPNGGPPSKEVGGPHDDGTPAPMAMGTKDPLFKDPLTKDPPTTGRDKIYKLFCQLKIDPDDYGPNVHRNIRCLEKGLSTRPEISVLLQGNKIHVSDLAVDFKVLIDALKLNHQYQVIDTGASP